MQAREEYETRAGRWRATEAITTKRFLQIGNARLTLAICAVALGWLAWGKGVVPGWVVLIPVVLFVVLVAWHQVVIKRQRFARRAVRFYAQGLKRMSDEWAGEGSTGERFRPKEHVYADDLDIFGQGSLFQLLSRARTAEGEGELAKWLLAPACFTEATARQASVRELAPQLDLREEIALLGEEIATELHASTLRHWADAAPVSFPSYTRRLALGLSVAAVATLSAFFAGAAALFPFLLVLACNFLFMFAFRRQVAHVVEPIDTPAHDLALLSQIIARVEAEQFDSPKMRALRSLLDVHGVTASAAIRRLQKWMELLDSSDHLILRVLRPVILWREQCALAVEQWRRENGSFVSKWLQCVAEFEALSSLATLAFERPHWAMPELRAESVGFSAIGLKHALLPEARCVANDVAIGEELRLVVVSGSNMSGKSTQLRAIGLATVLAWAGASVPASAAAVSALQVGASMRVNDSLQDNRSRFYAEILRLKQVVDLTKQPPPVLFLLDEVLSGTNSHDRKIGATAVVQTLLRGGAIGLITTHDLALAEIVDQVNVPAVNAHFEDTLVQGQIEFDYKLRPGTVTRSNALELMRAIGLEL